MANGEQLALLRQGVEVWNNWRGELWSEWENGNPIVKIDLSGADLSGTHLTGADLIEANLRGADLIMADLTGADLIEADLSGANLSGAALYEAHLSGADLRRAHLGGVDLSGVDLSGADLTGADLSRADLTGADLYEAHLRRADLSRAVLNRADLRGTDFSEADLNAADFSGVTLGYTQLGNIDLSTVKELKSVLHKFPSYVGIDTIYRSRGNIPEVFLRGCGVPENFITFMRSLTDKSFDFYSCFIIHSGQDKSFCERLHNDLQAKGVRTWYFPEDARRGRKVWDAIDERIKIYDKLVVVCSQNSLQSEPIIREIDRALKREVWEQKNILFPITLDRYIFDTWEHELKSVLLRKVIGEFSGWDSDATLYGKAFDKLLKDLTKE